MRKGGKYLDRSFVLATAILMCLVLVPATSPVASAEPVSITTFAGGVDEVTLTFKDAAANASAEIEVPRGATIGSARMDIEGLGGYGDDIRSLDFDRWDASSPNRAWKGWVLHNYPPTYPYWNPYNPKGTELESEEYTKLGLPDDDRMVIMTGTNSTGRYPFNLFRFWVPPGNVTGIDVTWEGIGQCAAANPEGQANIYLWNAAKEVWVQIDTYAQAGIGQERSMRRTFRGSTDSLIDNESYVHVLVLGPASESTGGGNPVTMDGELHTDYVLMNATLEGQWTLASDVNLTVEPKGEIWNRVGPLTDPFRFVSGFKKALQAAIDAETVLPSNMTVPLIVRFENVTSASIRLSNLSLVYEPVVNMAPTWTEIPALEMYEDVNALGLLDLDLFTDDDWSNTTLVYTVVQASTQAIEAVVETDHFLSFYVREANWFGQATFQVNATDPWGLNTTSPTIVLDVIGINDPPKVKIPGRQQGEQGTPFYYRVEAEDVDGDPFTFVLNTDVFTIDFDTGVIDFTPTNEQVGLHRVTISVTDDRGGEMKVWMELTILNVNEGPAIEDPGVLYGTQGEYFSHTFVVDDPDIIHGDTMKWELDGDPVILDDLEFSPVLGELVWRDPGNDDVGQHTIVVTVRDGSSLEDVVNIIIVIANVNDRPVMAHIADIAMYEDGSLTQTIFVTDPDMGIDVDERLSFRVEPPLFQVAVDGTYTFQATHDDIGEHQVTVTVTDRSGASHSQSFLLTIWSLNHPPVIGPIVDQVVNEDEEWTLEIILSDPDIADKVTVTARGAPFQVPVDGGVVRWTPQERHGGEHLVTLTANDGRGGITTLAFNLTVITYNDAPTVDIKSPRSNEVFGNQEVYLSSIGVDEEGDHLTFVWWWQYADSPDSQWEKITTGPTGHWSDPPEGKLRIKVEVNDSNGVGSDEVVIEVEGDSSDSDGSTLMLAAAIALAMVVIVVLLFKTGRLGGGTEDPGPDPDEEVWEGVDPEEGLPPLHRGGP